MYITGIKTPLFRNKESLFNFLDNNISSLDEGDILVITSKIIALSQGRVAALNDKKKLIAKESRRVIETPWAALTLTDDGWCLNAGIDESNADQLLILFPRHPFTIAEQICQLLTKKFALKNLGVVITDTKSLPLRVGTIGRAIAYAGFEPLRSYIGKKDLFGKKSRFTKSNIADALAAAAVLLMGEGDEQTPLVIIKKAPVIFNPKVKKKALFLTSEKDIYTYIFAKKKHS